MSYGYNVYLTGSPNVAKCLADIKFPGQTAVMADTYYISATTSHAYPYSNAWELYPYTTNNCSTMLGRRHNDGANIAFTDGHAKWYKMGIISTTCTPAACGGKPMEGVVPPYPAQGVYWYTDGSK